MDEGSKRFFNGHFPRRAHQRIDPNAAKPSGRSSPGFGPEEVLGHSGHEALTLLQVLPLATSGNLGTQVNVMA
jgi:hypothetical protein